MNKRVTIYDIAGKLGVSTATVNRALYGKPKVSEETRQLVLETARSMGFKANKAAVSLARKTIRIGFIIFKTDFRYNEEVLLGARKACEDLSDFNVAGDFRAAGDYGNRQVIIQMMNEMGDMGYDGIILCPTDDTREYEQTIAGLKTRNIPVVTVISDLPGGGRLFSVRNNGRISGKIAAEVLGMLVPGSPVAIFTGYRDRGIHKENVDGFMEQITKTSLQVVAVYENHDDPDIAYHATSRLLREYPDIKGIYIGTSNSMAVCRKITEEGYAGKIKIIASDVFPEISEQIRKGAVNATIFQEPFNIGRLSFKYLYEYLAEGRILDGEILLNPQIVLDSNLELFTGNT